MPKFPSRWWWTRVHVVEGGFGGSGIPKQKETVHKQAYGCEKEGTHTSLKPSNNPSVPSGNPYSGTQRSRFRIDSRLWRANTNDKSLRQGDCPPWGNLVPKFGSKVSLYPCSIGWDNNHSCLHSADCSLEIGGHFFHYPKCNALGNLPDWSHCMQASWYALSTGPVPTWQ